MNQGHKLSYFVLLEEHKCVIFCSARFRGTLLKDKCIYSLASCVFVHWGVHAVPVIVSLGFLHSEKIICVPCLKGEGCKS